MNREWTGWAVDPHRRFRVFMWMFVLAAAWHAGWALVHLLWAQPGWMALLAFLSGLDSALAWWCHAVARSYGPPA